MKDAHRYGAWLEHLRRISAALELIDVPPKAHDGFCGPEAGCGGLCTDAAYVEGTLHHAVLSVRALKKILKEHVGSGAKFPKPVKIDGKTWYQWACEQFRFTNCEECGKGVRNHTPTIVLGHWFARCKTDAAS
jgi:hypothetical protein